MTETKRLVSYFAIAAASAATVSGGVQYAQATCACMPISSKRILDGQMAFKYYGSAADGWAAQIPSDAYGLTSNTAPVVYVNYYPAYSSDTNSAQVCRYTYSGNAASCTSVTNMVNSDFSTQHKSIGMTGVYSSSNSALDDYILYVWNPTDSPTPIGLINASVDAPVGLGASNGAFVKDHGATIHLFA